jgi:zinc protease
MQLLRKISVGLLTCLLFISLAEANVTEYKLDNGLKLLVKEDHRAPVVVSQVWYKVGSSYEYGGITGISHQLEHMMFKGTSTLAPNEFSRIISANGGSENAFTGRDYTAYFQTLGKDKLEVSFKLEADRMRNLQLKQSELDKEIQVVAEERRMRVDDNPNALLYELFNATAFINSPYHHPIIGWMTDIHGYELADIQSWYQSWYAPNNATIVVAGDVNAEDVYQLAKRYFEPLKSEHVVKPKSQEEITQQGKREVTLSVPAELPTIVLGWKVPVLKSIKDEDEWQIYALEVLSGLLDGGRSARFSSNLIRGQEVAAGISTDYNLYARLEDVFTVSATPSQSTSLENLQAAILEQIEQLKVKHVSELELNRVKTQVVASAVYEQDSLFYQAMKLGMLETVGLDWKVSSGYVDKINAVTTEQVQAVANLFFQDTRLTIATLHPVRESHGEYNAN